MGRGYTVLNHKNKHAENGEHGHKINNQTFLENLKKNQTGAMLK